MKRVQPTTVIVRFRLTGVGIWLSWLQRPLLSHYWRVWKRVKNRSWAANYNIIAKTLIFVIKSMHRCHRGTRWGWLGKEESGCAKTEFTSFLISTLSPSSEVFQNSPKISRQFFFLSYPLNILYSVFCQTCLSIRVYGKIKLEENILFYKHMAYLP